MTPMLMSDIIYPRTNLNFRASVHHYNGAGITGMGYDV